MAHELNNPLRDGRSNVEINVGLRCNNRCVFCLNAEASKSAATFLPLEEMKAEIRRWADRGHRSIGFLGGEPTLYPHLLEAVSFARDCGFSRVAISTNGTRLHDTDFADRLIDAGLTRLTISMHGHAAPLEDRLTRVPGNFDKKRAAISHLLRRRAGGALKDGVSVNLVLNTLNYPHLLKIQKFFFETLEVHDLRVNFIRAEGVAAGNRELTPRFAQVVPVVMKALVLNETYYRRTFTLAGLPLCVLPRAMLRTPALLQSYVGEYRDLTTDCSIDEEDSPGVVASEGRARFNWQERKRSQLKSPVPACGECQVRDQCEGVWVGYLEIYGHDGFEPVLLDGLSGEQLNA